MIGIQDLRYAIRTLRKTPGFTVATVAILAFGIGANTAIFSLVQSVVLRELPYRDPGRLVWSWSVRSDSRQTPFNIPDFLDYRDRNRTFESISAFADVGANLMGEGEPVRVQGLRISANVFQMLGVAAALGRPLEPDDDRPGAPAVLVVSHALWVRNWGGDPGIVGRKVTMNGTPYTLVGVLPADFLFPKTTAEFAIPLAADGDASRAVRNSTNFLRIFGRLKRGCNIRQAQDDLAAIAQQLRREYPNSNADKLSVRVIPIREEILGPARDSLAIVIAAISLVLLIVTVNVANSMLARSAHRRKEVAIRAALGASRMQLVKHSLIENLMLAGAGGALGVLLARVAVPVLLRYSPISLPRLELTAVDGGALLFAAGLAITLGLLIGVLPARQLSRDIAEDLKSAGRGTAEGRQTRSVRTALVVAEVGLSFALLIGAGLLSRTLLHLQQVQPGFESRHLLAIRLSLPRTRYTDPRSIQRFLDRAAQRFDSERRITSYSVVSVLPLSGGVVRVPFTLKNRPPASEELRPSTNYRIITPQYFRTMAIPIIDGTEFSDGNGVTTQPVAIINQHFARRYFEGRSPIGAHLMIDDNDTGPRDVEIIGIVGNVKQASIDEETGLDLYIPLRQMPNENAGLVISTMTAVLRCVGDPRQMTVAVKDLILAADPEVALTPRAMNDLLAGSLATRQFQTVLMNLFAAFATLLVGFGLYGVMSYLTTQRSHEIGVRLALGATPQGIASLVMKQGMTLAGMGMALGMALLAVEYRMISHLLYMTGVLDPIAFGLSALLVIGIATIATWLPALRAARTDPVVVLRRE